MQWVTDGLQTCPHDLPDMNKVFYGIFCPTAEKLMDHTTLPLLTDENTSEANYVFLPVQFKEDGTPFIAWMPEWKIEDFE